MALKILNGAEIEGSTNGGNIYSDGFGVKVGTNSGYIQFGPANTSWAHIYTDRSNFYFNKSIYVSGQKLATESWVSGQNYLTTSAKAADSNLLDGLDSSAFVRKGVGYMWTATGSNALSFLSQNTIETSTGDQAALEVYQDNAGEDAFMQFHVGGDYAVYFGLDGSTNDLAVGGWSMGANKYKIWHAGNDGSGSGLDADMLDGTHKSAFLTNATVSNDTITFTKGDGSTFSITTSDANTNNYVSGVTFNTSDGVLTFTRSGLGNLTVDLDGRYAYASHDHGRIIENSTITYGQGSLQWMDISGTGGTGLNGSNPGNPFSDWFHHIIMNHANSSGYYVDIASCFHSDDIYFRRAVGGSLSTWREFIHTGNIGSQSVSYANSAGEANYAFEAGSAGTANNADYASSAGEVNYAFEAGWAMNAGFSETSGSANYASSAGDADTVDGYQASQLWRRTGATNATAGGGWITVAHAGQGGRWSGEVIVTDGESGDHSFIRIHWMRSYQDSNFTVLNCGGHANRITGARVLYQTSDTTYGWKYLQVYVTTSSNYYVRITQEGDTPNFSTITAVTPVVENTKSGYAVHGSELTGLDNASLAAEEGVVVGGTIYTNSHGTSADWNAKYTQGAGLVGLSSSEDLLVYAVPPAGYDFGLQLSGRRMPAIIDFSFDEGMMWGVDSLTFRSNVTYQYNFGTQYGTTFSYDGYSSRLVDSQNATEILFDGYLPIQNGGPWGGGNMLFRSNVTSIYAFGSTNGGSWMGSAGNVWIDTQASFLNGEYQVGMQSEFQTIIATRDPNGVVIVSARTISVFGDLEVAGAKNFRIDHPIKPETHDLVHSVIESSRADVLYRGKTLLVAGKASVDIDGYIGMTAGTFEALTKDAQCFTTNESGWTQVKGFVSGGVLNIEAQDPACTDEISWIVVGERNDAAYLNSSVTDSNGKLILEPEETKTMEERSKGFTG